MYAHPIPPYPVSSIYGTISAAPYWGFWRLPSISCMSQWGYYLGSERKSTSTGAGCTPERQFHPPAHASSYLRICRFPPAPISQRTVIGWRWLIFSQVKNMLQAGQRRWGRLPTSKITIVSVCGSAWSESLGWRGLSPDPFSPWPGTLPIRLFWITIKLSLDYKSVLLCDSFHI